MRFNSSLRCTVGTGLGQSGSSPEISGGDTVVTIISGSGTVTFN
jgi:hypothetical protein